MKNALLAAGCASSRLRGDASRRRALLAAGCALAFFAVSKEARAIRPFVTDDARVVGEKLAQLETWFVLDSTVLEHNALAAIGPTDWLEVTAGLVHGTVHSSDAGYSISGPIVQLKALVLPSVNNGTPGLAFATGVLPPWGSGAFVPPGWSSFVYGALTEALFEEDLLLHLNLGCALGEDPAEPSGLTAQVTTGFGAQVRLIGGLHALAEIYLGDPYDPRAQVPSTQIGARYVFSDAVQIDGTWGTALAETESEGHIQDTQWVSLGLRLVSPELW